MECFGNEVRVMGVRDIPLIKTGDDLGKIILEAAERQGVSPLDGDVFVVTQKIVSKAEGRVFNLKKVKPSSLAKRIARRTDKEAEIVELILRDAKSIVRLSGGHIITETRHGWICANSGVDVSNVSGGESAALLPINPDRSARQIRIRIEELSGR
ncbi:MAG: coenzyme F420-0:L-glutamate ligase, partial [Candidatus Bathyarchaeota archaeon]